MSKMLSMGLAAAVAGLILGAAALPANAAVGGSAGATAANPYCDASDQQISDMAPDISRRLSERGYTVERLVPWSGCVEATVSRDGTTQMLILDPYYLQPAGPQAS